MRAGTQPALAFHDRCTRPNGLSVFRSYRPDRRMGSLRACSFNGEGYAAAHCRKLEDAWAVGAAGADQSRPGIGESPAAACRRAHLRSADPHRARLPRQLRGPGDRGRRLQRGDSRRLHRGCRRRHAQGCRRHGRDPRPFRAPPVPPRDGRAGRRQGASRVGRRALDDRLHRRDAGATKCRQGSRRLRRPVGGKPAQPAGRMRNIRGLRAALGDRLRSHADRGRYRGDPCAHSVLPRGALRRSGADRANSVRRFGQVVERAGHSGGPRGRGCPYRRRQSGSDGFRRGARGRSQPRHARQRRAAE